jgi:DMSO/TMAO reductase YedYZ molybdopterin-dependent catalytic subunit
MMLALIFGVTLHGLLPPVAPPAAGETIVANPDAQAVDRRHVLRIIGGAALSLMGGAAFWYGGTVMLQGGLKSPVDARVAGDDPGAAQVEETATPANVSQANPTSTPEPLPTDTPQPPIVEPTATAEPISTEAPATGEPVPPTSTTEPPPATQVPTEPPPPAPTNTAQATPVPVIQVKEITPTESFYHISKNFFDPSPGSKDWKLEIKGLVDNPYSLTYEELTALPAVGVTTGMMCISNPIGGGLIGNAEWKGVRLADLLQKAKPKKNALELAMSAVDGYTDSITLKKALDPDVVLVWEMNGAPLTSQHGFPARLLVPGIYGMKHLKWITSIELVNYDFKGFWQQPAQGWDDPAPVNTMSRIDLPTGGTIDRNKKTTISGIAFAGDRSISKVEVSTDNGKTWKEAYVKPPLSGTSWVVWGYEWTPTAEGKYTVFVRATDGEGKLQIVKKADPYPKGATGYHSVTYRVK